MSPKLHFASLRRPLALWLAVLIAVCGALVPTLSHALVWSKGSAVPVVEVCTSAGPRWVASPFPADSPDGQESAPSLVHCPFCLPFTDRAAPAPHALVHLFVRSGEHEAPTVRQAFFFFTHFAPAPPPRGPPRAIL
ncbi:DUF2946 family protein [Rhodoferax sp.]|uniref:DUF2946 family protein n=1 Tax=Rhodoferax sp. TaxID=50421 RepID=UPI002725E995|nr:DUF2946 family protein [Rhodoferax sp.]MDO9196762.1 DUF2946 family protein [Rhodoferax sp.]